MSPLALDAAGDIVGGAWGGDTERHIVVRCSSCGRPESSACALHEEKALACSSPASSRLRSLRDGPCRRGRQVDPAAQRVDPWQRRRPDGIRRGMRSAAPLPTRLLRTSARGRSLPSQPEDGRRSSRRWPRQLHRDLAGPLRQHRNPPLHLHAQPAPRSAPSRSPRSSVAAARAGSAHRSSGRTVTSTWPATPARWSTPSHLLEPCSGRLIPKAGTRRGSSVCRQVAVTPSL